MKRTILSIFTGLLVVAAGALVTWLTVVNLPRGGSYKIIATLGQSQPMISSLGPEVRTTLGLGYQAILESPVYFDLRVMPWFNKATVTIIYEEIGNHRLVGLGRHTGPDFSYQPVVPDSIVPAAGRDKKAIFTVNLKEFYQDKNVYRFLVDTSNHQYQTGNELRIKSLTVLLLK